jgi:DNA-binding CsgD family transcriptional regulator
MTLVSIAGMTIGREVMQPGWRWSEDIKPIVGTEWCRASHHGYVVSGRIHVVMEDGTEVDASAGDVVVVPPGHDAWVVGDEPCVFLEYLPAFAQILAAGAAYREILDRQGSARASKAEAVRDLRAEARAGRLDVGAVELVLAASDQRTGKRRTGPAGLTGREMEVLVLIASGASTKQVAYILGIAPKTAATHIERIYTKTGASSRADATRFAIEQGLMDPVRLIG